jgi:hypothetical protein
MYTVLSETQSHSKCCETLRCILFSPKHNLTVSAGETFSCILFSPLLCGLIADVAASELFVSGCLPVGRTSAYRLKPLFFPLYK